ncbi:MAG TPA: hypothetical protein VEB18_02850 [Candidatus Paceibacterota bacterium]|nr:hypothetical protein [Candidatus Paceibacterota bacterium]
MQHPRDYVEHLRTKPVLERDRIALITAAAVTSIVALGYVVALASSDRLVLDQAPDTNLAEATSSSKENFESLLGAAAAFRSTSDGELTVIESSASSTFNEEASEATVIPF